MTKRVSGWNHIILEGFCTRHLSCKKDKYHYKVIDVNKSLLETEKIKNPCYDPNYKTPRKPKYCENRISNLCWEKECLHLGLSTADDEKYKKIMEYIDSIYKDDEKIKEMKDSIDKSVIILNKIDNKIKKKLGDD